MAFRTVQRKERPRTRTSTALPHAEHGKHCSCGASDVLPITSFSKANGNRQPSSLRTVSAAERRIVNSYEAAVVQLGQRVDQDWVRSALQQGSDNALNGVPMTKFIEGLEPYRKELQAQATNMGGQEIRSLGRGVTARFDFERLDPRAQAWAQIRAGGLVKETTNEQFTILRRAISDGINQQLTSQQIAQNIRGQIGLTDRWATAVQRATDKERERLIKEGLRQSVVDEKAEKFAQRYHDRLLRARAKNIARTEIQTAQNMGRYLSWQEAGMQGLINMSQGLKEWRTGGTSLGGTSVCEICLPLQGEKVLVSDEFSNGTLMPPAHPSCRCTAVLMPLTRNEIEQILALPNEAVFEADALIDEGRQLERSTTNRMKGLAQSVDGQMHGLAFRIKDKASLARKINDEVKLAEIAGKPISHAQAASQMKDVTRYTIHVGKENYAESVNQIVEQLRGTSQKVNVKNFWANPRDGYKGINTQILDQSGRWYELQIHTVESQVLKDTIHPIYGQIRSLPQSSKLARDGIAEMERLSQLLVNPKGATSIVDGFVFGERAATNVVRTQMDDWSGNEIRALRTRLKKTLAPEGMSVDLTLHAIGETQGFTGLPRVVATQAEGELLTAQGWRKVYRGVKTDAQRTQYLEGQMFMGTGVSGNGVYSAESVYTAIAYAESGKSKGAVIEIWISPNAKLATREMLVADAERAYASIKQETDKIVLKPKITKVDEARLEELQLLQGFVEDDGKLAAMMGYDGILLPNIDPDTGKDFVVLLNRSVTAAKPFTP